MPATKTSTKDNQLYREYEKPDPDETALQRRDRRLHRDYLYRRRHLPVSGGKLKWSAEVDDVETAIDDAMERILTRDGRLSYREASDDLLRGCAAIIYYLDDGPKRLRMMREYPVRICERLGVKFPGPTRHSRQFDDVRVASAFTPIATAERTRREV
jgi:hypothetical protein